MSVFLALAALFLLGVIAVQDYLVPVLRNETISEGLTGPYHWYLDGAFVILAAALSAAFFGHGIAQWLALATSVDLLLVASTKTFAGWVNKLTNNKASMLHSLITVVMLLTVLGLESTQSHGWMWALTGASLLLPTGVALFFNKFKSFGVDILTAAEKAIVVMMCVWFIVWAVIH